MTALFLGQRENFEKNFKMALKVIASYFIIIQLYYLLYWTTGLGTEMAASLVQAASVFTCLSIEDPKQVWIHCSFFHLHTWTLLPFNSGAISPSLHPCSPRWRSWHCPLEQPTCHLCTPQSAEVCH